MNIINAGSLPVQVPIRPEEPLRVSAPCEESISTYIKTIPQLLHAYSTTQDVQKKLAIRKIIQQLSALNSKLIATAGLAPKGESPSPGPSTPTEQTSLSSLGMGAPDALKNEEDNTLLGCIEKKLSLERFSLSEKNELAKKALETSNDTVLAALIRGGCTIYNDQGASPLLLDAVSHNLIESVKALIEKHANLFTVDEQKNNALHRAFFAGNPEIAKLLMQYIDPQSGNRFSQTPLMALLKPHEENRTYIQQEKIPAFLEALFKRSPEEIPGRVGQSLATKVFSTITGGTLPPFPVDIVEMAYLANNKDLDAALLQSLDLSTFLTACETLEKRYPRESVSKCMASWYAIDPEHFQIGGESVPVPPLGAKNPPLTSLIDLLKGLNFNDSKDNVVQWAKAYTPNGKSPPNTAKEAVEVLEKIIQEGVRRISEKIPYGGVPPTEPQRTAWFQRMELLLKHIIIALDEKKDPSLTLSALKQLVAGFNHCATGLNTAAINVFEQLYAKIDSTDKHLAFMRALAQFRRQQFDIAAGYVHDSEIHVTQKALVTLGPELGLPGHEEVARYVDLGAGDEKAKKVKDIFLDMYTPQSILTEWLFPGVISNIHNLSSLYVDLQDCLRDPHFDKAHYDSIVNQLSSLEKEPDEQKRKKEIETLLTANDIFKLTDDQDPRVAIQADQRAMYRATVVYDPVYLPRPRAALHLLTCLGILKPKKQ